MQKANPVDGILHARDQSLIFLHAAFSLLQFVVYFQTKDFDIFSFFLFYFFVILFFFPPSEHGWSTEKLGGTM